ncbi:MAG: TIGR01906 family membrane protein [Clostridiales Family XIII bacterium]|jgi:integral membrane protein (TIGR01906 family)|nr:TIGR01906 family membrane protein [Clostridiales Family XIII bacterium]
MKKENALRSPQDTQDKWFAPDSVLAAALVAIFVIAFAVVATVNFRPLYYHDMAALDIPARSGMSAEDARLNYDVLIDYNMPFAAGELRFPTLSMSDAGRIHFAEVKRIFNGFYLVLAVSLAGLLLMAFRLFKKRRVKFLKLGGIFALAIPAALGFLLAALGWEASFVLLHRILFDNDYWIFDSVLDPVILILPDAFFSHCLYMILELIVFFAATSFFAGVLFERRRAKTETEN